jgi:hypothetical protein
MLAKGNVKLGKEGLIWNFSIPAIFTCPGKTPTCTKLCYANRGFYWYQNVQDSLWSNYQATLAADFVDMMLALLVLRKVRVCRIHVAGDFYSFDYARKWSEVIARLPATRFYLYTRSWRVAEIRPASWPPRTGTRFRC